MSEKWEKVGKAKKPTGNGNKKPKSDKRSFEERAPKIEDIRKFKRKQVLKYYLGVFNLLFNFFFNANFTSNSLKISRG